MSVAEDFDRARREMLIDLQVLATIDPVAAHEAITKLIAEMNQMLAEESDR
jgi:hypothetical protein